MGVQPEGVEGASGKPPPRLRRGETLCNIKGTTAQFVGNAGDAFSTIMAWFYLKVILPFRN